MPLLKEEEEEEEGEAREEEAKREEEWREEKMLQIDEVEEDEEGEEVEVLQKETELSTEPLTFSANFHLLTSAMFKRGKHVSVGRAEQGVVRFVGHTHFKEGVWIRVELQRQKGKNDGYTDE